MSVTEVREGGGRRHRPRGLVFDLAAAGLRRPQVRPGTVWRSAVLARLMRDDPGPVVSVAAPAGYGKTTLLSQWAERDARAFAWVSVNEPDDDPKILLACIAEALDAIEPVDERVFDALASPASSVPGSVVPRLGAALWAMSEPFVLVVDDVHVLRNREGQAALSVLADHVPAGSRLVLAGRTAPPLRLGRLRAQGQILEIGQADLSLTCEEAASLLRGVGLALPEDDVAELHRRTEGWPTGLYLAALYLKEGGALPSVTAWFGGEDRFLTDYMESEFLERISQRQRSFLTRTAVLERMCGSLCEAVLEQPGSAAALDDLARSNLLLVPLDRRGHWYRYHHLFRDMLLAQLERDEPGLLPVLRQRAARWYLQHDMTAEALEYYMAAGNVEAVAGLAERLWLPAYWLGPRTTIQRWLGWLEARGGIEGHPMVAVWATMFSGLTGRPTEADRWADAVDRWQSGTAGRPGDPVAEAWAALLRASHCRGGAAQMRADADQAVRRFAEQRIVEPGPAFFQGVARLLCGDLDGGDASLQDAVRVGEDIGSDEVLALALCERSLLAMADFQWSQAEVLADQADAALLRAGLQESYATSLISAVRARVALHRGDVPETRKQLVTAQRLRSELTYAIPYLAVQARIELARVHLALADIAGARTLMREIDELLQHRPGLGTLTEQAQALRARLAQQRQSSASGASALTAAELRLLPLLATHLSFPEIGQELLLSLGTIKTQTASIYRKLEASSRSQAVARSRELGLLEG